MTPISFAIGNWTLFLTFDIYFDSCGYDSSFLHIHLFFSSQLLLVQQGCILLAWYMRRHDKLDQIRSYLGVRLVFSLARPLITALFYFSLNEIKT